MIDQLTEIRPQVGPQEMFMSSPADVAFIGGAAGGGKTYALLMEPLRYIETVPGFGCVFFRRESPQITAEGGPWDTAGTIYPLRGAVSRESPKLEYKFKPYNNVVTFSHMQHEKSKENWLGAQIPLILFDQLETFTRSQFVYMLSRNRSLCGVIPYIRGSYNPVPQDDETGGWLHEFVGWYLDDSGEYADPSKAGVVRWFVNVSDKLHWYDSRETAVSEWPNIPPLSFTFIPSRVQDNKILLETDPTYLAKLHGLNLIDQERLLKGNHKIRAEAGKVLNRSWFRIIPQPAPREIKVVFRFYDFAATEKKKKLNAATASVKMALLRNGSFCVLDMAEEWIGPAAIDALVINTAAQDGTAVPVRWEEEGGSSGKRVSFTMVKQLAGYNAGGIRPAGDKLQRLMPFSAQARVGNVSLVRAPWNDRYLSIMHNTPDGLWDVRDATSGAFALLANMVGSGSKIVDQSGNKMPSKWGNPGKEGKTNQKGSRWRI